MWQSRLVIVFSFFILLFSINTYAEVVEKTTTVTTSPDARTSATSTMNTTPPVTTPAPSPASVGGQSMIVTPVPTAKEVIATPQGYVNCFTVEAGWYKNAWVPAHRVCQYDSAAAAGQSVAYEGVAWIEGYWACTQYSEATCTKWEWKSGRWVKTLEVY